MASKAWHNLHISACNTPNQMLSVQINRELCGNQLLGHHQKSLDKNDNKSLKLDQGNHRRGNFLWQKLVNDNDNLNVEISVFRSKKSKVWSAPVSFKPCNFMLNLYQFFFSDNIRLGWLVWDLRSNGQLQCDNVAENDVVIHWVSEECFLPVLRVCFLQAML